MNCQEFEEITLALARNRRTDAATREQGFAHADACARCSDRLADERKLIAGVNAVVAEIATQHAPASVEAALLTAFRQRVTDAAYPAATPMPIKSWHSMYWRLEAVAAIILISASAIFWQQFRPPNQKRDPKTTSLSPSNPAAGGQATQLDPSETAINRAQEKADRSVKPGQRRQARNRYAEPRLGETEVVTEFFALMDEERFDSRESLQVMRVELPGSALVSVGLLVDASMASEPVKADVVLGPDGLARAIRFVR